MSVAPLGSVTRRPPRTPAPSGPIGRAWPSTVSVTSFTPGGTDSSTDCRTAESSRAVTVPAG